MWYLLLQVSRSPVFFHVWIPSFFWEKPIGTRNFLAAGPWWFEPWANRPPSSAPLPPPGAINIRLSLHSSRSRRPEDAPGVGIRRCGEKNSWNTAWTSIHPAIHVSIYVRVCVCVCVYIFRFHENRLNKVSSIQKNKTVKPTGKCFRKLKRSNFQHSTFMQVQYIYLLIISYCTAHTFSASHHVYHVASCMSCRFCLAWPRKRERDSWHPSRDTTASLGRPKNPASGRGSTSHTRWMCCRLGAPQCQLCIQLDPTGA